MTGALPLWAPSPEQIESAAITDFMRYAGGRYGTTLISYEQLYNWSVEDFPRFWECLLSFSPLQTEGEYSTVVTGTQMPGAEWFPGLRLNYAQNLLRNRSAETAIISLREGKPDVVLSFSQLHRLTASVAAWLLARGVVAGDRVCGYCANGPEAVIAMLAAASIGAVWSSTSPDFGFNGVYDRFSQIQPKILFATAGYQYNGKTISVMENINRLAESIPSLRHIVLIPSFKDFSASEEYPASVSASPYTKFGSLLASAAEQLHFEQLPFSHPLFIMYSSGTTGKPKCIVHSAGGTLLQHYKEHALHCGIGAGSRVFFFTTCGWMMWNWLVSSLACGAAVVLYDGSPLHPGPEALWQKAREYGVTHFGTSPKYLSALQQAGYTPAAGGAFPALQCLLSTGSPLAPELFHWAYANIKTDMLLASISGGTDIISCFMLGCPILPVYAGEIQCRGLGMAVQVFNGYGKPVTNQKGELVCTKPFPSMPVGFWADGSGEKYKAAYFSSWQNVWRHGDFVTLNGRGGMVVYGRSDSTLNPGGVRIGTAEIYNIVEAMEEFSGALVIGQQFNADVRLLLFVVCNAGVTLTEGLIKKVKAEIRAKATPRHVPALVLQAPAVPVTINGKKVELAVSRIINGETVDNKEALANPEVLAWYGSAEVLAAIKN